MSTYPMSKVKPIKVANDGEMYRLKQAQTLLDDFERDQGRPATDIKELEAWSAKSTKAVTKKSTKGQK
jgi:hypothetical protein